MALAAAWAPSASAAGTPVAGVQWTLALDRHLRARLDERCVPAPRAAWRDDATGRWDPAHQTGSVTGRHAAPLFQRLTLAHGRAELVGRIGGAPRRLAAIAHPHLRSGPLRSASGRAVPNTLRFTIEGSTTITSAFAATLDRARCTGRSARGRPIRAGAALGQITTQVLPRAGTGLGGTVDIAGGLRLIGDQDGVAVAVTPSDGPRRLTEQTGEVLRFVLPPGTAAPLTCNLGLGCYPASGAFALPGLLALSYGGRAAILAGLTVTYTPTGGELPDAVVTGTLDGAPVTIADDPANPNTLTTAFTARVGAALGAPIGGTIGQIEPRFTATGPL